MVRCKQRKAFTIVEMVIVIAVIAILATVMIPTISGVIRQANISADKQFAASLNIQLAMESVDREILNESDLRDVINKYYGADYFETKLSPKSAKHGYYFWYDYTNKTVTVGTVEEIADLAARTPGAATMSAVPMIGGRKTFSPASLRSDLVPGYYLMGCEGGVLNIIKTMEGLNDEQAYEDTLNQLKVTEETLEKTLYQKLTVTTIETDYGIFACEGAQEYWYRSVTTTVVDVKTVYVYYPDKVVGDVEGIVEEVDRDPVNPPITVAPGGIEIEISSDTKVGDGAWAGLFDGKVEVHVDVTDKEELKNIFHMGAIDGEMVIVVPGGVLPNGNECYFDPDNAFEIVYDDESGNKNLVVEVEPQGGMENLKVEINYNNSGDIGTDADYFYEGTLFLAWDFDSASLSLDKLSNSLVNWTVSDGALIQVSPKGEITLKEGVTPDAQKSFATVTATLKKDPAKTHSINVQLVFPTSLTWKLDGTTHAAPTTNGAFDLSYTEATEFALALDAVGDTQSGYVKLKNTTFAINFATSGTLFTIENNKTLKLDPAKIATNPTQTITVTYGTADHTYISQTYTVTVVDNSATPFENNKITDIKMGQSYLFRVGNANTIKLSQLFNTEKAPAAITLNIYDASKALGEGKWSNIATSDGFSATYTSSLTKDAWADSTIKFSGTGVAIIEITTAKGTAKLAVEVVDGYNITDASQLKSNANNILLNDIKLASGGTFSLTGDAINHKVLYGNGFKFDITDATTQGNGIITLSNADIDNVRIIGKVYTTYAASSSKDYYASAVFIYSGSARISNSYIYGTRSNVRAGSDLEIVNSVLECARFANVNLTGGTLTIDGLTTISEPRPDNSNIMGMGIVIGEDAGETARIKIKGALTQYNWICADDESKMPSVTGLSTFVDTIFETTEYVHTIDGVKYANLGIICMTDKVSAGDMTYPNTYSSKVISKLGYTGFVISIRDDAYDATAEKDLIYRNNAYNWTPEKQANTVPTIKWTNHSSGTADVTFVQGTSGEFDPNVFSATKYGNTLTHTITANGTNYTGKKITFTNDQQCVITYTVTDNKVYDQNGVQTGDSAVYEYTLVVNVTTTVPDQKEPEFAFAGASGFEKIVVSGKTYVIPTGMADSTKFYHVGNGIYAPIVDVQIKDNTSDFTGYYPIFGGISITWYDASGNATTYDKNTKGTALPTGLEWLTDINNLKGNKTWNGYKVYSGAGLCRESDADGSSNTSDTFKNVEFSFQPEGGEKYYYYIRFREPAHEFTKPSVCVTGDTLVTLADGTQKQIQYVTYEDMLLVWNFNTGKYDIMPASIIQNHGYDNYTVVTLNFSDGTTVNTINGHGFFNVAERKYVIIDKNNATDYVGHEFAKVDGNSYSTATLESFSVSEKHTESWSILTAVQYNCILENMWTLTPAEVEGSPDYLMPFEIGADMKYDEAKMQADIEKYGLYTYEDFAEYCTYEQFVDFNFSSWKVAVEKGYITWDGIEFLLNLHLGGNK